MKEINICTLCVCVPVTLSSGIAYIWQIHVQIQFQNRILNSETHRPISLSWLTLAGNNLMASTSPILGELTDKWRNKAELDFSSFELQKSFHLHHTSFKDSYLK